MGKLIKYFLLFVGGLFVLGLIAVFVVPKFIDVQKYKPVLIEKIAAATGRPVSLGGDLHVSVFPWVGVSFSDFRLGNPEGFEGKDFIVMNSFEVHVKVMPLLKKEILIDSFVIDGPELYLERDKDGRANWEGLGRGGEKSVAQKESTPKAEQDGFGLKSIVVGEFSIINGTVRLVDKQQGTKNDISALNLQLKDVNLERPIELICSALVDGKAVGVNGQLGPLGPQPGQGTLPLDITFTALEQIEARIKGKLENPATDLSYAFTLDVAKFSPRKVFEGLGMEFPISTNDPKAIEAVELSMMLQGGVKSVAVTDGKIVLDNSNVDFSVNAKSFSPLQLAFDGSLDSIDLDRYLPPGQEQATGPSAASKGEPQKTDYEPLRKLALDAKFSVGELRVKGGNVQKMVAHLTANKGIIKIEPFSMDLYGGNVSSIATVNVQSKAPASSVNVKVKNVQVGPLLKDFAKKDVLDGTLVSTIALSTKGDTPEAIKRTLNGKGELLFTDGAIIGVDLAGMVRNAKASFGLGERTVEKPRTDFAELRAPFTLKNGLFNTPGTALQSPLMRVNVEGTANLVNEALDMKVNPKFVATLKGQGDTAERKGVMIPVLVTGTFSSPKFSPDLAALLQSQIPDTEDIKKALEGELNPEKLIPKGADDTAEGGLKSLIPKFNLK